MARKIKVKLILELRFQGISMNEISTTRGISKHSVCRTCNAAKEKGLKFSDVKDMAENELYHLLFPDKHLNEEVFEKCDMEYVHTELGRLAYLKLLHAEYLDECSRKEAIPMSYSKILQGL